MFVFDQPVTKFVLSAKEDTNDCLLSTGTALMWGTYIMQANTCIENSFERYS